MNHHADRAVRCCAGGEAGFSHGLSRTCTVGHHLGGGPWGGPWGDPPGWPPGWPHLAVLLDKISQILKN